MFNNSSSHRLVGKFFTNSTPPSFHETEQSLRKQWSLSVDDMTVQKLEDNDTFLFNFREKNHKLEVLIRGPFYVNGVILVIKNPISPDTIIDFTVASFAVGVVGLPSYLYTEEYFQTLKSQFGAPNRFITVRRIDKMIYFVVEVDLKKPLKEGFYVKENRFVEFRYRNLGIFCYNCGMIGHVKRRCDQVRFPKERALNATSRTNVYGPWLRVLPLKKHYESVLVKSLEIQNLAREVENTLSYAQFFIELEFNCVYVCNPKSTWLRNSTRMFRFPCSYLDTETESTDITTSKAYEVIRNEISENTPFSLEGFDDIKSLVEKLKLIKKNEFCCDDKWLTLKLQINRKCKLMPVAYETMLAVYEDRKCERLIASKISDLIKERVEKNEDLRSLTSWENQIRQVIVEMGLACYMNDVSERAKKATMEAVEMEFSLSRGMIPADKSIVSGLERFKVLGSDMDRFDPCMICVEEMFLAQNVTLLPCSHVFHSICIDKWLEVGHKCPLCGFKLLSEK